MTLEHIKASLEVASIDFASQVLNNLSTVVTSIISNNCGKLLESVSIGLDSECLLALNRLSELLTGE